MMVRRAAERVGTEAGGITTLHSFSYGAHYDPENVRFGPILALNEERIEPGGGYGIHRHFDVAIVTFVIDGMLAHEDSVDGAGLVRAGQLRRTVAGEDFTHVEHNASRTEPVQFLQLLLEPRVPVTVEIVESDRSVTGPALLHVVRGGFGVDGESLGPGDEARLDDRGPHACTGAGTALLVHGWA